MPISRREFVPLPFAERRHTPDTSRLSAMYLRGGEILADLSLKKGEIAARTMGTLQQLFSNYQETGRRQKATEIEQTIRKAERDADRAEREAERKARQQELDAAAAERASERAYRRGAAVESGPITETQMEDVLQGPTAGRARYAFGPGTAEGPELMPSRGEQQLSAIQQQVERMGGVLGPNGQIVMPPKPQATKALKMEPALVGGRRTFVVFDPDTGQATDFTGRPVQAEPIPPASQSAQEPLVAVVGPDGRPVLVRRSEAEGKTPAAGSMKPATGLEKRALNFFNRAEQADKDLEVMEAEIQKLGLFQQGRLEYAPNWAQSQQGQLYRQAQRAFTEARLRKDSGAAIPPQEFENDRQTYFAQPGDTLETLEQKRRGRAAVLASLGNESGQALGEFLGDPEEAKAVVQQYRQRSARKATVDEAPKGELKPGATVTIGGFTVTRKP